MGIKFNKIEPDYITAPGDSLKEIIKESRMTQEDIARRLGITPKNLSNIVNNKANITSELALKLEYVLDVPAKFWNNLTKNYEEFQEKEKHRSALKKNIEWLKNFNYLDLYKKGFVPKTRDKNERADNMLRFFGYSDIELMKQNMKGESLLDGAYKITTKQGAIDEFALKAWIRAGDIEAKKIQVANFSKEKLKKTIPNIRKLALENDPSIFVPKLQKMMADLGIAVVFVPELKGCRVSGMTRWSQGKTKPIIELSLRYKTNDLLWFTLFHEIGHLILHDKTTFLTYQSSINDVREVDADEWASNILIPTDAYIEFVNEGDFSKNRIISFANEMGIHPGIVVGRLQRDKYVAYNNRQLSNLKIHYRWGE